MSDVDVPQASSEDPVPATPPPGPAPGPEDLLGLRIAAALIDLLLLAGVLVILSTAVGQASVGGGNVSFYLTGTWAVVFLALALGYYFVLEAWAGQTVGKRLLGLRVLSAGGARPSVWAVAGRTLLRIVDWLPLLYLAGFITMLATGTRRQRIGDLAARTAVARAVPVRHRGLALVPLAVVLLAAVALPVYRTSAGGTPASQNTSAGGAYQGQGVSFTYPVAWTDSGTRYGQSSTGEHFLWRTAVTPGTPYDGVMVTAYPVSQTLAAQNIGALIPALESDVKQLFGQAGGGLQAGPEKITMAGKPAVRFRGTGVMADGTRYTSTIVFAFNGTTEYFVNCQYTAAKATAVTRACDQVVGSFHVGKASAAQGNPQPPQAQPSSQAEQQAHSDLATLRHDDNFARDLRTLSSDAHQAGPDLATTKSDAALGTDCYNVSTVKIDASNVAADATIVRLDLQSLTIDIDSATQDIATMKDDLANLSTSGLSATPGAQAAIAAAGKAIRQAAAKANGEIDPVNADVTQAYSVANGIATGSCSGDGPGHPPAPIRHIASR
jgi:uncharacterized RDD family membrane protein YckC